MTDSRWLQELTNAYINKSAGVPSNINEELITEQGQYISELENIIITVAESLEVSVEDLMEALNEAKQNTSFSDASAKRKAEQAARQAAFSAKNRERLAGIEAEKKAKYFPKYEKGRNSNAAKAARQAAAEKPAEKPAGKPSSGLMQFGSSKKPKGAPKAAKASKPAPESAPEDTSSVKLTRVKQVDVSTKPVTEEDWSMGHVRQVNGIIQKPTDHMEHSLPITQAHHEAHHAYETLKLRAAANPNNFEYQQRGAPRMKEVIDRSKVTPDNPRGDSGPEAGLFDTYRPTNPEWIEAKENLDRHNNLRQKALRDLSQRHTDSYAGPHHTNAYTSTYDLERYLGKVDHPWRRDNTPEKRKTFGKFWSADHGTLTPHVSHYDKIQAHVDSLPAHVRAAREAHPEAESIMREKARLANGPTDLGRGDDAWVKNRHASQVARNREKYLNLFTVTRDTIKTKQHGMRIKLAKQRGNAARARARRMG